MCATAAGIALLPHAQKLFASSSWQAAAAAAYI
jgi:hypothetical protein